MLVDWNTYYEAGKQCHELADALRRADKPLHDAVKGACAGMAGDAPGCKQWGESYDQVAQQSMQTCTSLANALTNFGSVLYASGYNYGISNTSNPPTPGIQQVDEHKVAIPTSVCNNGIGIEDRGGVAGFFDGLVSRIVSEFGKLPNGDIDKLDTAQNAWTDFARNETITSASARISAISALFDSMDETENRQLIQEHFDTLRTSAEYVGSGAQAVAASVGDYHNETVALGESISSSINALELTIAVAALGAGVAFLFSLGTSAAVGGAAIAADVAATATTIRSAYQASNLLKVVGLAAVAAGAVGVIDAFNDVPNLQQSISALAGIIALKISVDETGALSVATAHDDLPLAPEAPKPEDFTDESEKHVVDSHFPGGSEVTDRKSVFRGDVDRGELVEAAENVKARGPNKYGNYEREVDAGEVIGTVSKELGGRETNRYMVVTDKYGTVMTMYPI